MSTRATILFKDDDEEYYIYRQEVFGRFDDDEEPRPAWADDLEVFL